MNTHCTLCDNRDNCLFKGSDTSTIGMFSVTSISTHGLYDIGTRTTVIDMGSRAVVVSSTIITMGPFVIYEHTESDTILIDEVPNPWAEASRFDDIAGAGTPVLIEGRIRGSVLIDA